MQDKYFLLHEKLLEQCKKYPEKIIIEHYVDGNYKAYTYGDIEKTIVVFAEMLEQYDIKKEHIAVISENNPGWICAYFAVLLNSAVNVPVDPQLTDNEIISILNDAEVKAVFTSVKQYSRIEKFKNSVQTLQKIIIVDELPNPDQEKMTGYSFQETDTGGIVSLLYTSGTTAVPKGVMLSHKNLSSNFNNLMQLKIAGKDDIVLGILPFYHIYPFMTTLLYPLLAGIKVIIAQTLKGEELLKIMREKDVSYLVGVPQLFKMMSSNIDAELKKIPYLIRKLGIHLIRKKLHNRVGKKFRFFLSGGAKLDVKVAKNLFRLGLPVMEGYGLTETSPVVTTSYPRNIKIGSAGRAIPDVEIRIDNPDKDGVGEVLIKGPNVMEGYYKKDEETKDVIRDGWFHSGDMGHIDKDGYLYITGRIKEVIVLSSGKNIYPEELEVFYSQIPFIKEMCIIGRPIKEKSGLSESLWAIIVPDIDFLKKMGSMDIHNSLNWALRAAVEKQPAYRRLSGFTIAREDLPRTRLGKIKRYEVEDRYRDVVIRQLKTTEPVSEAMPEDKKILESPFAKKILDIIARQTKLKREISINDHMELDLGIDSLGRVELLAGIETALKVKLPDQILSEVYTVKDLVKRVGDYLEIPEQEHETEEIKSWDAIISQPPSINLTRKINLHPGWISCIAIFFITRLLFVLYKTIWKSKIYGKANIPRNPPYIICSNHQSYLDGPLIASSIPFRAETNLYFLGYRYYFELPVLKYIMKLFRIIPIDTTTNLVDALRASLYVLNNKKALCIFPEGARTPDGSIHEFKKGIGILVKYMPVPLVPVYIKGSFESWPIGKILPISHPITIRYGKPISPHEVITIGYKLGAKDEYSAISIGLREEIEKLGR